jgi:hypothetical protein
MARRRKSKKGVHCKMVAKRGGGRRKMCFNAKGKIVKNPK